jgi:hypothetical protein
VTGRARIIVTGSRDHDDRDLIWDALALARWELGPLTVVHGAAPGADRLAVEWVRHHRHLDCIDEPHPAQWQRLGRAAGPIRNQQMVDAGAVLVLGFPLGRSVGTRDCMARATRALIEVREIRAKAAAP